MILLLERMSRIPKFCTTDGRRKVNSVDNFALQMNRVTWIRSVLTTFNASTTKENNEIHLTGAATNPWIWFESDNSFIKFEIGTNWFNLVQIYSPFLLHILHSLTLSIFNGQNLFNIRLHLQYSTFNYKLQLHFILKL